MGKYTPAELRKRRFRAILLRNQGKTIANVAEHLNTSRSWVKKWCKRFKITGDVLEMKHPGRPIKLTKILSCKIKRMAKNKRIGSIRKIQLTLKTKDINISLSSIHKTLKSAKLIPKLRGKKPFLSQLNKLKRLKFARKYLKKGGKKIGDALFFMMNAELSVLASKIRVWVEKGEEVSPTRKPSHPPSIMVAGAINSQGKTKLYRISGILNQDSYTDFLSKKILPDYKKSILQIVLFSFKTMLHVTRRKKLLNSSM